MSCNILLKSFPSHITSILSSLYSEALGTDVTLVTEDGYRLQAHRAILTSCCPALRSLLLDHQEAVPVLVLTGVTSNQLKAVLQLLYLGYADLKLQDFSNVVDVLQAFEVEQFSQKNRSSISQECVKECFVKLTKLKFEEKPEYFYGTKTELGSETFEQEDFASQSYEDQQVNSEPENEKEGGNDLDFKCSQCEQVFNTLSSLQQHCKKVHSDVFHYCDLCSFKTKNKYYIKEHIQARHIAYNVQCEQCNKVFKSEEDMNHHLQKKHSEFADVFDCPECPMTYKSKGGLKSHMKVRHEGQSFLCDQCDHKTLTKIQLNLHRKRMHENFTYDCKLCDYKGLWPTCLRRHTKEKHSDLRFYCDQCDYSTSMKYNFNIHVESVHGEKKYTCDQCEYSTGRKGSLNKHINGVHKKEKFYSCKYCDHKTNWSNHLRKHIRNVHKIIEPTKRNLLSFRSNETLV